MGFYRKIAGKANRPRHAPHFPKPKGQDYFDGNWGSRGKGIGTIAINVIYEAALSWTQAGNAGDVSLLKGASPSGAYYKEVSADMTKPAENKTALVRVAIDPESIQIKNNQIIVDATEHYLNEKSTSFFSTDKNSTASWSYTLEKMPDQDEWWIVSHGRNFWGRNALNAKNAVMKNNPDVSATES
ncbi:hypothetical protein [Paenibacillus sp. YN15]|uniref:hypothetical protein n=1 Tax=Paenibacillus sp. YN15 TaxID=1742774 RepID=UPI000DCD783D|nr:hypothetical protein [Paenibacillus sp. YN15]RAU91705.1 hypothetical protein DQG13_28860 [Paenibacillus sp. YN15]